MNQFDIYKLFCMRYIDVGAESGLIVNFNEFLNHCKFLNHFKTYRKDKLIWRKLRAKDLAAVFYRGE